MLICCVTLEASFQCFVPKHLGSMLIASPLASLSRSGHIALPLIPDTEPLFTPISVAVVLQLLAYYTALNRGCPIDKPRNLAKSVTVE